VLLVHTFNTPLTTGCIM